jgi:DNA-binding CsgD family transcriptional regulator
MQGLLPTPACILLSLALLTVVDVRGMGSRLLPRLGVARQVRAWPQDPTNRRRHGRYLVVAAAILTVIFSLNDAIVVSLDASGSLELFSWVRLFYALGLVVAGCLFDLGPRFAFTFSTVAVQILAVLVPYFLWMPEWYNLNMALFYFYGGFYVMFITAEFVAFSGQMANGALWAALGRTTRSYVTAFSVIPVSLLYASFGVVSLVALGVVLNMAFLGVCVADTLLLARYRLPVLQADEATSLDVAFDEQDVEHFAHDRGLTDRECEVLLLMVTTEDENQKMASDLGISRRTLQRHIAQVYEKAGVESRIGLYKAVVAYKASRRG